MKYWLTATFTDICYQVMSVNPCFMYQWNHILSLVLTADFIGDCPLVAWNLRLQCITDYKTDYIHLERTSANHQLQKLHTSLTTQVLPTKYCRSKKKQRNSPDLTRGMHIYQLHPTGTTTEPPIITMLTEHWLRPLQGGLQTAPFLNHNDPRTFWAGLWEDAQVPEPPQRSRPRLPHHTEVFWWPTVSGTQTSSTLPWKLSMCQMASRPPPSFPSPETPGSQDWTTTDP